MTTIPSDAPQPVGVDALKAVFDRGLAALVLVVTAPLFVLGALAILIDGWLWSEDGGPIFHRETRVSAGRQFSLFKFRTMQVSAIEDARRQGFGPVNMRRWGIRLCSKKMVYCAI